MEDQFKQIIKQSFSKFREHMNKLENDINLLKSTVKKQNDVIKQLTERIVGSEVQPNNRNNSFFYASIGKKGVKQTNKHLNTSLNTSLTHDELSDINEDFNGSTGNDGAQERLARVKSEKEENFNPYLKKEARFAGLRNLKHILNTTFSRLSKQELKVFLTVYQLEDEKIDSSYRAIAERLDLSEGCVRTHVFSLLRKQAPLYKVKINNKLTHILVDKEFKALSLKNKLIRMYYEVDPQQTTLFDIKD